YNPNNNFLYGGGSNGQCKASQYDPATGNEPIHCQIIAPPCATTCTPREIRHMTLAPNGNPYGYTAGPTGYPFYSPSTIMGFTTSLTGIYHICSVALSQYWMNGTYFVGCYYMGNGIAATNCYVYIYSGDMVEQYDILNTNFIGSTTIAGGTHYMNSGILA